MSMNLYIQGKRSITVDKTNKKELQFTNVGVWQTPTNTTREIIKLTKIMEKQTTKESTAIIGGGAGGLEVTRIPDKVDDVLLVLATLGAI